MKIAVRYFTRTGNTKKLADTIAAVAGVKAQLIDVAVEDDTELLFLGSSVYAAGVDNQIKDFILKLNPNIKKVVCFSTAAILKSSYVQMVKLLSERNIPVDEREFHCRGAFTLMHIGHPNEKDLKDVSQFAKDILNS